MGAIEDVEVREEIKLEFLVTHQQSPPLEVISNEPHRLIQRCPADNSTEVSYAVALRKWIDGVEIYDVKQEY